MFISKNFCFFAFTFITRNKGSLETTSYNPILEYMVFH